MKKLFLFITILVASYNLGAQEDFHLEGAISKSYGYLSLTTAERDALGLGLNDRKTIWNSTDDELQYWTGISWICQSCVGTTTLQASIAADPDATSKPNFQGGIDVGLDNGSPAIVTLKGGTGGSANLTIASTIAGAVLAHSAGISFTAPSLIVNGDPVSHFYEDGYNASTDDLSLSDGDSKPNGWETFVTVAGSHDFGSGAISLGENDVIQKIDGVYRKKVDNNQSGGGGSIVHDDNEIVVGTGAGTETFDNFTFDGTVFKLSSDPAELNSSFYFKKNETASGSNISHLSVIEKDSGIGNYSGHGILQDHNVTANATSNGASALYTQNDKEGTGDLLYFYSQEVYTNHKSDSDIGFLNGITLGVTVEGLNSTVSTGVRGISPTVNLESPTSVITGYVQGIHPTINLDNGTLNGNSEILFLDYDWDGTNYTHNGNLSYIRATDDNSIENLTTSGWKRFISYEGNLNSYFGGSLTVGGNYTLPAVDGTNGQVLKTDGSGILTWQDDDDSGGGSTDLIEYKITDEVINSDNTLSIDSDLTVSLEANSIYTYEMILYYSTGSTEDFKSSLSVPGDATGWTMDMMNNHNGYTQPLSFVYEEVGLGTSTTAGFKSNGIIKTITAGNVSVTWAQNTSGVSNTTLYQGSYIRLTKLN